MGVEESSLCKDVKNSEYISLNDWIIVNHEEEWAWKKVVVP
jgi:hypothetical protein